MFEADDGSTGCNVENFTGLGWHDSFKPARKNLDIEMTESLWQKVLIAQMSRINS